MEAIYVQCGDGSHRFLIYVLDDEMRKMYPLLISSIGHRATLSLFNYLFAVSAYWSHPPVTGRITSGQAGSTPG